MDIYAEITARIINQMEQGIIPWQKPWYSNGSVVSHSTGKPYSLLNQMLLGKPGEYLRRKGEVFERKVIVYINETHNQDWEFCAPVLQLEFHHYSIDRYISENCPDIFENYETIATEVRKQFAQAIRQKTQLDYERTNRELDKKAEEILEQLKTDETICLLNNENELKELAMKFARQQMAKKEAYFFWPSYLSKQDKLIQIFID